MLQQIDVQAQNPQLPLRGTSKSESKLGQIIRTIWGQSQTGLSSSVFWEHFYRTSGVRVSGATQAPIELTPETESFCREEGILGYLRTALELIESCFSSVEDLSVELEEDPETAEEWVVVEFTTHGEVEQVLDEYQGYTHRWVSSVPWPERNKIALSYNIV